MKPKSMQSNILIFFFASALLAMSFTLGYISYSYHKQFEQNIKGALGLILSDIKYQHIDRDLKYDDSILYSDEMKESSLGQLLADLKMEVTEKIPMDVSDRISVYRQLKTGQYIVLSCSRTLLNEEVFYFMLKSFAIFASVFVSLVAVFVVYVRREFKSLNCLVDFCQSYQYDKSAYPVCNGTYEVKNLRNAILSLIKSNDNLCVQKQELFKEAAHELKAPIAVLKARMSLFGKDEKSDKKEFVHKGQEDISHITSKLKELLFLKSIEWDMQLLREDVNMQENCKMMQEAFAPILQKKNVKVDSQWEESFVIHTYKEAMGKVLQAVFENIFIHTRHNSTIYVRAKPSEIYIKNEIGGDDDIPLFSSYIGTKMIERLSGKLAYEYIASSDYKYYYTRLIFHSIEDESCTL